MRFRRHTQEELEAEKRSVRQFLADEGLPMDEIDEELNRTCCDYHVEDEWQLWGNEMYQSYVTLRWLTKNEGENNGR